MDKPKNQKPLDNISENSICERHQPEIEITKADAYHRQWCLICQEKCPFYFNQIANSTEQVVRRSEQDHRGAANE
ncbi:MAG: hypothetical protein COT74_01985 [Bdellovibrionales bacterium CG10_big_fil_rev_8_21_14_0_10_45_34]|nr:MAG: hypothetical protein COT74_01985 [Bdellovibrionales bacterium CG10_big_fil_rev_8_21_14_0_10_45_34]